MKKDYTIKYDIVFKNTFNAKEEIKRLIKESLELEVNDVKILNNELPVENKAEKKKILDLIVYTDKGLINVEVNNNFNPAIQVRNLLYFCKLVSSSIDKDEDYINISDYIQLNLTWNLQKYVSYDISKRKKITYYITDEEEQKRLTDKLKIVTCNMDYYLEKWYTGDIEGENPFMMLLAAPTIEQMELISKGDKLMEDITKKVKKLNIDPDLPKKAALENDEEKLYNSAIIYGVQEGMKQGIKEGIEQGIKEGIEQGIKEGIEQGIEQGFEQRNKEIVCKMKELNIDINQISEITGLSIEEINNL